MFDTELTRQIIGAAIANCLCRELALRHICFQKQKPIPLVHKGTKLDCGFRLDLLVEGKVFVELKCAYLE